MLGGWEFAAVGNVSMGVMAIVGVISLVYAVGTSLSSDARAEEIQVEEKESSDINKAA